MIDRLQKIFNKISQNIEMPRDSRALPTEDAGQLAQGLSPSSWEDRRQNLLSGSAQGSPRLVRVDKLHIRVGVEVVENEESARKEV